MTINTVNTIWYLIIILAFAIGVIWWQHNQIVALRDNILEYQEACEDKDAKIGHLIKALSTQHITICEPRRKR